MSIIYLDEAKPNCTSRISRKTLYQIGVAKFLGVEINWRSSKM